MTRDWSEAFRVDGTRDDAVVLLHGFTGHPGHWTPLRERLVEGGYTVAAPRLSGHGSTLEELHRSRWRDWVDSARRATEEVAGHRHVHLVGLSMGGLIAVLVAGPTAASSLTIINAPVLLRESKAYLAPVARHLVPFVPAPDEPVPDPDLAHLWVTHDRRSSAAADQLLRVMWHAWGTAGRLRRPAMVIQSRSDETVHPLSGRILARRLRARLRWVDTRHNALLDRSREEVHRLVVSHLGEAANDHRAVTAH